MAVSLERALIVALCMFVRDFAPAERTSVDRLLIGSSAYVHVVQLVFILRAAYLVLWCAKRTAWSCRSFGELQSLSEEVFRCRRQRTWPACSGARFCVELFLSEEERSQQAPAVVVTS